MTGITKPQRKMQFNLRIEHELHEWLKKTAEENERPINYVITQAIKNMRKQSEGAKA
ncbi:toxin-antitoxin system HicB family antitoxin [Acinetobacter ursingii]|uniref:toxin-antitoxin system HicB family antitoxin n=1 Tax=Acinetobacter ursingii TaxID=108980 RepID=UPI0012508E22|nr:Arc family DNA-binding protein [Acinetobacter ursingii]